MGRNEEDAPPSSGPHPGIVKSATELSALVHDLNNILTTVMTYADLLAISFEAGPELDDLREIKKAAFVGAGLTRKLMMVQPHVGVPASHTQELPLPYDTGVGMAPRSDAEPALTRRMDE